jgi:hypothetical protein
MKQEIQLNFKTELNDNKRVFDYNNITYFYPILLETVSYLFHP